MDKIPLDKQRHLWALALISLTEGKSRGRAGDVDISILIDATTFTGGLHDQSVIDCGLPIELPVETIRRNKPVVVFEHAYHGRTNLAMAMTAKNMPYKDGFGPFAPEIYRVPMSYPYRD